jgi:hypothetical protein
VVCARGEQGGFGDTNREQLPAICERGQVKHQAKVERDIPPAVLTQ